MSRRSCAWTPFVLEAVTKFKFHTRLRVEWLFCGVISKMLDCCTVMNGICVTVFRRKQNQGGCQKGRLICTKSKLKRQENKWMEARN